MQGGQPDPGRGVYVVRRIVAALVVLLLLVLLVPRACQALFTEEESGSRAPETAATDEDIVAEKADTADDSLDDGEIDARGGTGSPTGGTEAGRSENSEELSAEVVNITEVVANLEAPLLEGSTASDQAVPVPTLPSTDAGDQQQPVQPVAQQEPVQPVAQQEPVQPIAQPAGPPALREVEPVFFFEEEPIFFGEPVFFEEPFLLEAPILFENNIRLEEGAGGAMDAVPGGDAPTTTDSGGPGAVAVSGAAIAIS
jgi:hypothetical protein